MSSAGNNNNNHNSNNEHFKNYSYLPRVIGYNLTEKNCSFILQSNPINQRSKTKALICNTLAKIPPNVQNTFWNILTIGYDFCSHTLIL